MSTDFREYSAAFHDHQNELMHYGVKGMTWDPSKKKKRLISEVADKELIDAVRKDEKYKRKLSNFSSEQLRKKIKDTNDKWEWDSVYQHKDGSKTMSSDNRRIAAEVLNEREQGLRKEPTNPYNVKKTGLQKAATEVARKEEKKRNRKLINARKAERAYRRGGH